MRGRRALVVAIAGWLGCGGGREPQSESYEVGPWTVSVGETPGVDESSDAASEATSAAAESSGASSSDGGEADAFDPAFALAQVDAALAAGVPGLAIAIVHDGEVVLAEGFGVADEHGTPVDATTLFNLASVTKHVTALTILSERDEGLLGLDTPVPEVFPELALRAGFDPYSIEIRHLLTHTSGLGDWPTEPYTPASTLREEFVANPNQPLWFTPGAVFDYSNRGFTLAGLVAAQVHGGSFAEAVEARVLAPLGMHGATVDAEIARTRVHARGNSSWDGGWIGPDVYAGEWYMPAGGLWVGAGDLGALLQALVRQSADGFADGTLAELGAPVQPTHEYPGAHYGYGLFVDDVDPRVLYHGGSTGGYMADLQVVPSRGFAVAIAVNTDAWAPSATGYAILEHYAGPFGFADEPPLLDAATIPGSYHDPWQLGPIEVSMGPAGLQADFTDAGVTRDLVELWPGAYECEHPSEGMPIDVMFWPGADGSATHFVSRAGVAARVQ